MAKTKAIIYSEPSGTVRKVRIGDTDFNVSGASVITQGGLVGLSLTIIDLEVSGEVYVPESGQTGSTGPIGPNPPGL